MTNLKFVYYHCPTKEGFISFVFKKLTFSAIWHLLFKIGLLS